MPLPPDEKVTWPGLALAWATTSIGAAAGLDGLTIMTLDTPPTSAIGAKSLTGS